MNQNTDSDLDELERQFTCDVGDWNEVQRRPNASRQNNNRQNAAAAQRNDRTSSPNGAERANRSSAQNTQGAFAGDRLPWDNDSANARRQQPRAERQSNPDDEYDSVISMMRMHTTARTREHARRSSAERATFD